MKRWGQRLLVATMVSGFLGGAPAWSQQAPAATPVPATKPAAAPAPKATGKVNINTADEAGLTSLKGIGKVKAQAILDYRQKNGSFKTVDDLAKVKGIGEKTVAKLKEHLTVE
ncbi:MAG: helix-hairpin-helix domain-containing protein [Deltaproteobacteria bacterium]|nr:helix-hairpin-helix domain-containing protein [Deltaproteobacteria bacterium]